MSLPPDSRPTRPEEADPDASGLDASDSEGDAVEGDEELGDAAQRLITGVRADVRLGGLGASERQKQAILGRVLAQGDAETASNFFGEEIDAIEALGSRPGHARPRRP